MVAVVFRSGQHSGREGVSLAVELLQVTAAEMETRTDVFGFQGTHKGVAIELRRVHSHDKKMPCVCKVVTLRISQRTDLGDIRQQFAVEHCQFPPFSVDRIQPFQLADTDRGRNVGQVVFEAGEHDFRLRGTALILPIKRIHSDTVELPCPDIGSQFFIIGQKQTTLAGSDIFDRMERKNRRTGRADMSALVVSTDSMGGIFHDGDISRNLTDTVKVERSTGKVNRQDHSGSGSDFFRNGFRGGKQRFPIDIAKNRSRPGLHDHVGHGNPGHRGNDNLISGAELHHSGQQVHGGGRRRKGDGILISGKFTKSLFQLLILRTVGKPSGTEYSVHGLYIIFADGRLGER